MTRQDLCDNGYEDVIVFENEDYEDCIVGVTTNNEAVYSKSKMVEWYMKQYHCSEEEALEWIKYNTEGSIGFEGSPIILELDKENLVCYNKDRRTLMWEKIKAFFSSKVVKVVSWIVMFLDITSLIVGGVTEVEITDGVKLIMGIVGAIALFITFIRGKQNK